MLSKIINITHKIEEMAVKSKPFYSLASLYYKNVIEREATLANVSANDNVLCIGGGICPFSAILLHQITGAKVTVIDNNCECIPKAKEIIAQLNLTKFIKVLHEDGLETNLKGYTVIHLALQVSPVEDVFRWLEENADQGARILMRRSKKHLSKMYCKASQNLLENKAYVSHKSGNIGSTLLYTKEAHA